MSNVTAGNPAQIKAVMDAGGIEPLLAQLKLGEWEVKKEAAWAISNIHAGATDELRK